MSDTPKWDSDPKIQAEFLESFRKAALEDLAAIRRRLIMLLMPAFIILLAVLGLNIFTWIQVTETQQENEVNMRNIEKRIEHFRYIVRPATIPGAKAPGAKE